MHTTPFCAYVFNLIFVNFSNNNTFALPVFGYFKLVRLLRYIFCLFYVCLRRHTHTHRHSQAHIHTQLLPLLASLLAFCEPFAHAPPPRHAYSNARQKQQQQHQLQQQKQHAHVATVLCCCLSFRLYEIILSSSNNNNNKPKNTLKMYAKTTTKQTRN